jgi:signal transduction histidine kinase
MAMASGTMRSLRETLKHLRPPEIDDLGLIPSLHALVRQHNDRAAGRTRFSIGVSGIFDAVPADTAAHVYRIVQEALNNAARHANAKAVQVTLSSGSSLQADGANGRRISLTIADDGVGVRGEIDGDRGVGGVGLIGMRERVLALNGEMAMGEGAEQGFELRISFPERDVAEAAE